MKKILLFVFAISLSFGTYAQEEGNPWWLGGTAGFGSSNVKDGNSNSGWQVGPQAGYMLNDNMGVGLNLLFNGSTAKQNNNENDVTKMSGWMVEPLFRYYFAGSGNFKFFGDAAVGFGGGKTTMDSDDMEPVDSKYSTWGIRVTPGAQFWFNSNWSMLASIGQLGYSSRTNNVGETLPDGTSLETTTNDFGLNIDFDTFNLAFFWHF